MDTASPCLGHLASDQPSYCMCQVRLQHCLHILVVHGDNIVVHSDNAVVHGFNTIVHGDHTIVHGDNTVVQKTW